MNGWPDWLVALRNLAIILPAVVYALARVWRWLRERRRGVVSICCITHSGTEWVIDFHKPQPVDKARRLRRKVGPPPAL